jgi:HEAT repeat protein
MTILLPFLGVILSLLIPACSPTTEEDLANLHSPNDAVKVEAIQKFSMREGFPLSLVGRYLNQNTERKAVAIMVELLLRGNESEDIQLSILKAMGELGKRTEVPVSSLIEKLRDGNPRIRLTAVESLGKIRDETAVPALIQLLETETDKYPIIWALGEIGDKRAVPALNQLLASQDKYAIYNANKALKKIR